MGGLPLFFQVFGLSCSLMFVIAVYAFSLICSEKDEYFYIQVYRVFSYFSL